MTIKMYHGVVGVLRKYYFCKNQSPKTSVFFEVLEMIDLDAK